jgi:hypothetical protein
MEDHTTRETHDYTRRSGVMSVFTVAPEDAPDWAHDPEQLANAMEARETRKNSQLAFECRLALPAVLDETDREEIAREFTREVSDRYGVAAIVAIHAPDRNGDERNFHAHILFTTRQMEAEGLTDKVRAFNSPPGKPNPEVTWLRESAANFINDALERAGFDERVDHRSYVDRGIDRVPTEHLGPIANEIERDGRHSHKGDKNREAAERNEQLAQTNGELDAMVAEYAALEAKIAAEEERRLDARWGEADPDYDAGERFEALLNAIADAARDDRVATPEQVEDEGEGARPTQQAQLEKHGAGGAAERLDEFADRFARQIDEAGELQMRDGLTWWERTVIVFGEMRDNVTAWARERWQGFVDFVDSARGRGDNERDDPDLGR